MGRLIFILGDTGTGKSSAIAPPKEAVWTLTEKEGALPSNAHEALNPKSTFVINIQEGKDLPFRSSKKIYNKEEKNFIETRDTDVIIAILKKIDADTTGRITDVVIDDWQYQMSFAMYDDLEGGKLGWDSYKVFSVNWYRVFKAIQDMKRPVNCFILSHTDTKKMPGGEVQRTIKTVGSMTENLMVPEGMATCVLYTHVVPGTDKKQPSKAARSEYYLVTNQWNNYPAKSPSGMFDTILIPNSLQLVKETIETFYN